MKKLTAEQLPDDIDALKMLLVQQQSQLLQKQQRIDLLEEQILLMRDKHFARSSEQSPDQYGFFDEAEAKYLGSDQHYDAHWHPLSFPSIINKWVTPLSKFSDDSVAPG